MVNLSSFIVILKSSLLKYKKIKIFTKNYCLVPVKAASLSLITSSPLLSSIIIVGFLFGFFKGHSNMPSLPQGGFAACKVRSHATTAAAATEECTNTATNNRNANNNNTNTNNKNFLNEKLLEYTPVKYNSKLMNSIWGLYNRYSPHNIKGNDDEQITK